MKHGISDYLLTGGISFLCIGTYLGGWAIAIGHILLILAMVFIQVWGEKDQRYSVPIRLSCWCLTAVLLIDLGSVLVHWDDYEKPLRDIKKLRYLLIPLSCLLLPQIKVKILKRSSWLTRVAIGFLILSLVMATCSGLVGHFTGYNPLLMGPDPHIGRAGGVYGQVMTYAYSLQFAVLFLLGLAIYSFGRINYKVTVGLLAVVLVGIVGLYFSYTRGAVLGFLVGGGILLLIRKMWFLIGGLSLVAIIVLGLAIKDGSRFVSDQNKSNSERLSHWRVASLAFLDNPLVGIGFRQLEKQSGELKEGYNLPEDNHLRADGSIDRWMNAHAHNNYLEAFAASGLFGGLAFIGFCAFWLKEVWESDVGKILFFPSVVGFLVSGFFETTFTDGEVLTLLMILYVASQLVKDKEVSGGSALQLEG